MIEALPAIVERHPKTTYLVLGATHPHIVEREGEQYRLSLQRRIRELGLEEHVLFRPRFVELNELLEYIGASDICVTPYLSMEQITSGALAYALGSGKAVVSTPYWHAEELLADGRGRIVPVRDSAALSREILDLLDNPVELNAMRKRAYLYCRSMTWSATASEYVKLFDEVRSRIPKTVPTASAMRRPLAATNLPLPKIDHLVRLSDDTVPRITRATRCPTGDMVTGWTMPPRHSLRRSNTDGSSRAVIRNGWSKPIWACSRSSSVTGEPCGGSGLFTGLGGTSRAGVDWQGSVGDWLYGEPWVATSCYRRKRSLSNAAPPCEFRFDACQRIRDSGSQELSGTVSRRLRCPPLSRPSCERPRNSVRRSDWIEKWNASDWPVAVKALIVAAKTLGRESMRELADKFIGELLEMTSNGTVFLKKGNNPIEEEHPVTAAAFIEAIGAAFYDNRDPDLLQPIRTAADWFLGDNRRGTAIYQFATGGCYDAVTASGLNRNQGTEATAYCLIAFTTLHRLAGLDSSVGPEDVTG